MPKNKKTKKAAGESWLERGPVPAAILVIICAVCVALLALTATATAEARAFQAKWLEDSNKRTLFPGIEDFPAEELESVGQGIPGAHTLDLTLDHPDIYMVLLAGSREDPAGLIIGAQSKGYGGKVPVMVGFDLEGNIVGIVVDASGETAGLGQKTADPPFTDQFRGRAHDDAFSDIDSVSSATVSSVSVVRSVRTASAVFAELMQEGGR